MTIAHDQITHSHIPEFRPTHGHNTLDFPHLRSQVQPFAGAVHPATNFFSSNGFHDSHASTQVSSYWQNSPNSSSANSLRAALLDSEHHPDCLASQGNLCLSSLDHFHCLGLAATERLAELLNLRSDAHILDIGTGIGGPARYLALNRNCRVTGIDVTKDFVDTARQLNSAFRISESQLSIYHGDGQALPFDNETFDAVWIQVTSTNIPNRTRLYKEIWRTLKPQGLLGVFDIFAGPSSGLNYPVPWATSPRTSFLLTIDQTEVALALSGLEVTYTEDASLEGMRWFLREASLSASSPIGFHVLLPRWAQMAHNQALNIAQGRIRVGYMVARKIS